jgi:hypothetical protein
MDRHFDELFERYAELEPFASPAPEFTLPALAVGA